MEAGMYFPVHEIQMLLSIDLVDTLIAFNAITGCDSVSRFSGHAKKPARVVFKQHHTDLIGLGKGSLCPKLIQATKHESIGFLLVVHKRLCHQHQTKESFTSCVHTITPVSGTKHTCRSLIFLQ